MSVGVLEAGLIHGVVTTTNLDEYSVEAEVVPDGDLEACLIIRSGLLMMAAMIRFL